MIAPPDDHPAIVDPESHRLALLPAEIVEAGRVHVTGVIHPMVSLNGHAGLWLRRVPAERAVDRPCEDGVEAVLGQIVQRCREIEKERPRRYTRMDQRLEDLIRPERARQRKAMIQAMERVADLVWGDAG